MTPSDFESIEQRLGISLPGSYTALLAAYPPEADNTIRTHTLFEDTDRVIKTNLACRGGACFRIPWPNHYFVIGDNECDGVYFMALGKDDRIYFADHEDGTPSVHELEDRLSSHSPQEHLAIALKLRNLDQELKLQTKPAKWWQIWK